jgi:hypothetical protein
MDGVPEASPVRTFASLNCFNLYREHRGGEVERYERVAEVIRELDVNVIAIQELCCGYAPKAASVLSRLAHSAGMTAAITPAWMSEDEYADATYAVGVGAHGFHVALMWRDVSWIQPVPGSFRSYGGPDFRHALVKLTLTVDGRAITFGSYHATPFGRNMRAD